ncbi:MAG: alpha/beta hydrolase [Caldilineaceae bacterium]|nr:alpha/beta hydrolase [Caldilineaceae bacterium]
MYARWFARHVVRLGFAGLIALAVLLSVIAAGQTQSNPQVFLPLIQQDGTTATVTTNPQEEQGQADQTQESQGQAGEAGGKPKVKPHIVLVHGAWADGTGWQAVIERLIREGYTVTAVQNPLTSLVDDVATTKRVLDEAGQKGPVIAVGHSYGGAVITGAAAGNPNVKALVYIAAFAPEVGEPIGALLGQYPTELGNILVADTAGFAYLDRTRFRAVFAADVDRTTAQVMAAAQKPAFGGIFGEALTAAAWKTIPSWYMIAKEDKALSPAMERFLAKRMGATTVEIKASHVPYISKPGDVVKFIEKAVKATSP